MKDIVASNAETQDRSTPETAATVYFDGSCPLCTAEISHYAKRAGTELQFVDVSRDTAALGPGLTSEAAMARFHLRQPDGALLSGARAFIALWQRVPGWRWVAWMARVPGGAMVLEGVYRAFLRIRPTLSWIARRLGAGAANPRAGD